MKGGFLIFNVTVCISLVLFVLFLLSKLARKISVKKMGSVDGGKIITGFKNKIMKQAGKSKHIYRLIRETALRFSVFNTKSMDYNETAAIVCFTVSCLLTVIFSFIMTAVTFPLWYMGAVYSLIFAGGICLVFSAVSDFSVNSFLKHMPEALRVLNSRYISRGNIIKAIAASMDDFPNVIRREMVRIYDALKQNDMGKIRETFAETEEKYSGEYVTIMLELIWHAYYNGGNDVVKIQFDNMTEDIINELENKSDVRQAAVGYVIMALLFIPLLPAAVLFNNGVLEDTSTAFYGSMKGMLYTVLFFVSLFAIILIIMLEERKER